MYLSFNNTGLSSHGIEQRPLVLQQVSRGIELCDRTSIQNQNPIRFHNGVQTMTARGANGQMAISLQDSSNLRNCQHGHISEGWPTNNFLNRFVCIQVNGGGGWSSTSDKYILSARIMVTFIKYEYFGLV
jgi:hypothetical protein